MNKILIILTALFLLAGFGERVKRQAPGAATDHTAQFSLLSISTTNFTFPVSGTNLVGTITRTIEPQEVLNGVDVIPHKSSLSIAGKYNINVFSISYYNLQGLLVKQKMTNDYECTPVTPDKLPALVRIGDKGVRSLLNCKNPVTGLEVRTLSNSWEVKSAYDAKVYFIIKSTTKDDKGKSISKSKITYTIDQAGNIVDLRTKGNDRGNGKSSSIIYEVVK